MAGRFIFFSAVGAVANMTSIPIVDSPFNCKETSSCQDTTVALHAGGRVLCEGMSSCQGSIFICLPRPESGETNCTRVCNGVGSACQTDGWLGRWQTYK